MITIAQLWPIFAAATASYIVGILWYSPILFMKPWMRGIGKTEADLFAHKNERTKIMVYSFFISFATAFGLSTFFTLLGVHSVLTGLQVALLIAFSFIITTKFADLLYASREPHWSRTPQELFLVESGYTVASFLTMATTLVLLN